MDGNGVGKISRKSWQVGIEVAERPLAKFIVESLAAEWQINA